MKTKKSNFTFRLLIPLFIILIALLTIFIVLYTHPKIAVLCYHNIATAEEKEQFPDEADWTITTDNFKEHLDYLKKHIMQFLFCLKKKKLHLKLKNILV